MCSVVTGELTKSNRGCSNTNMIQSEIYKHLRWFNLNRDLFSVFFFPIIKSAYCIANLKK